MPIQPTSITQQNNTAAQAQNSKISPSKKILGGLAFAISLLSLRGMFNLLDTWQTNCQRWDNNINDSITQLDLAKAEWKSSIEDWEKATQSYAKLLKFQEDADKQLELCKIDQLYSQPVKKDACLGKQRSATLWAEEVRKSHQVLEKIKVIKQASGNHCSSLTDRRLELISTKPTYCKNFKGALS